MAASDSSRQDGPSADVGDLGDPVEFIYGEHERIRRCCQDLVRVADDPGAKGAASLATAILEFLENDLPLHLRDEEDDLFPLLRQRAQPEDRIASVLDLLCAEHRDDIEQGHALREPLRAIAERRRPADPALFAQFARAFTLLQRRHHAIENNTVMPLADERLTAEDKKELARRMAARRALPKRAPS